MSAICQYCGATNSIFPTHAVDDPMVCWVCQRDADGRLVGAPKNGSREGRVGDLDALSKRSRSAWDRGGQRSGNPKARRRR